MAESTVETTEGWAKESRYHRSVATLGAKPEDLGDTRRISECLVDRMFVSKLRFVDIEGFQLNGYVLSCYDIHRAINIT
jgi:hypothetical protein